MEGLISAPNKPVSPLPPPSLLHQSPKPAWPRLCPWGLCAQCGRAHSPSPCPQAERWLQPVSHGPLNQGTAHAGILQRWRLTRQGHGERSKACCPLSNTPPTPTPPGTTLNCPPPGGRATCSLQRSAVAHRPPGPHLHGPHPPSPGTFLQRLGLAWGKDRPIPVASSWVGTPGSLRVTRRSSRNWTQTGCKGRR